MFHKEYYIFFLFILASSSLLSQQEKIENLPNFDKDKIHFGFYLGLNKNNYKINYKGNSNIDYTPNIESESQLGFNVGLIADLKLHKNVNFRFEPGLISNTRTLYFKHLDNAIDSTRTANNTYLHLPFVFKISTDRLNNIRPYVLAGVSYDHNFSSNEKNANDNASGEFRQKRSNFMYELGIGIDIYLPYFKLSPSIRGLFAINNELVYDNPSPEGSKWTDPVNFLGTSGIFLHLAFE